MIHNGTVTIESPRGGHRTFRIRTQSLDAKFAPGERIVSLLAGPDNESDYVGFGFVSQDRVRVWAKKLGPKGGDPSEFEWFARMLSDRSTFERLGYTYHESRKCSRCNRKLTTPESIERGIGPECATLAAMGRVR